MLSELEAGLGYTFRDKSILENALTHSSYANENRERGLRDNERLEFLGDSILGFVVADYLYRSFPDRPEGELTRIRADLVCEKNLARAAGTISLGSFLLLGHGEEHGGGRKRDSIVSDAMESVIAASYMDGGFSAAKEIIDRLILCDVPAGKPHNFDYKTALQELVQRKPDQTLRYEMVGASGPDHARVFAFRVLLNGQVAGTGEGRSKKEAEQAATRVIDGSDGNYNIMTSRFGSRQDETTDRYGNALNPYWDLFRQAWGLDNGKPKKKAEVDNPSSPDNKESIWVLQYNYGTYSTGGGGDGWWRVRLLCTEANWLPAVIMGNQTTRSYKVCRDEAGKDPIKSKDPNKMKENEDGGTKERTGTGYESADQGASG
mgnify:CR=1 FL=1